MEQEKEKEGGKDGRPDVDDDVLTCGEVATCWGWEALLLLFKGGKWITFLRIQQKNNKKLEKEEKKAMQKNARLTLFPCCSKIMK